MAHVPEVHSVELFNFHDAGGARLLVHAKGEVESAGWSALRLSPRFYAAPPADGIWEFDFEGDPPCGPAPEVPLPAHATAEVGAPDWITGVKVYAAQCSAESADFAPVRMHRDGALRRRLWPSAGDRRFRHDLVRLEDACSPLSAGNSASATRVKTRRHTLTLAIDGPDEGRIRCSLAEAGGEGLLAAIVAAYGMGGGALMTAVTALLAYLQRSLGSAFDVRVDHRSEWIERCT